MDRHTGLEKFLSEEFGLSDNELALYIALFKNGASTILDLSKDTGINRATTHVNIESLTRKKLVAQVRKGQGSRRSITPEPPEKLHALLKQQKAKIEAAEQQLPEMISELASLKSPRQKSEGMDIRYYQGKNEVRFIYDEILKAKEIRAYINCDQIFEVFPGNMKKFLDEHAKRKDMSIWEIMDDCRIAKEYISHMPSERYYYRLASKRLNLASMDYLLFDGKVAIIDVSAGINGVVIENKIFYENSKAIYEFVWGCLPPPTLDN